MVIASQSLKAAGTRFKRSGPLKILILHIEHALGVKNISKKHLKSISCPKIVD
jgi:hypothetical protein